MRLLFNTTLPVLAFFMALLLLPNSCRQKQVDPAYIQEIEMHRQEYLKSFVMTDQSPLSEKEIKYLKFFSPDPDFKIKAKYVRTPEEKPFQMPTYSGKRKNFIKHGELHFNLNGVDFQLSTYKNLQYVKLPIYKDVLFVPFKDYTNGETSYGGGRYIDLKLSDIAKEHILLDFNKAYNPWCAYSDGYNCPIPPIENHLEIQINAGEKNYDAPHKQRGE